MRCAITVVLVLALTGCTELEQGIVPADVGAADFAFFGDTGPLCSDPSGDYDGDGIPNGMEGCLTSRDSDGDKVPDWQDFDSDGDKLPDSIEKGARDKDGTCLGKKPPKNGWPCDTDGDGAPDYLDKDADGDGLLDGDEDHNYDGQVGCCLTKCNTPASPWQKANCKLVTSSPAAATDGCGKGQKCALGLCMPSVMFACAEGETSPTKKDTFGDGKLDKERGSFVCRDATEDQPQGRKPVQLRRHLAGDWHIAMEKFAKYGEIKITGAPLKMAAASINYDASADEVAGFVISKATTNKEIQAEHVAHLLALSSAGLGTVTALASGTQGRSHDMFDAITSTVIDLTPTSGMDVSSARDRVVAALLGRQVKDLTNLSAPLGSSHSALVLRFTTVRRFAFKKDSAGKTVKDSKGYPVDDGDKSKWQVLVIGAVASQAKDTNPKLRTGLLMDDLANGTGLATYHDSVSNECDVGTVIALPKADIIWVIDESGSMSDNRQDIVNNANAFFSRALSSGMDFRMGVTNVVHPPNKACIGKFCSCISTNTSDTGCQDRFLLPTEQAIFSSCVNNPTCYEGGIEYSLLNAKVAVTRHLPRMINSPKRIRKGATLVIIVATDEVANGLSALNYGAKTCPLDATTQANVDKAVKPYLDLFSGSTDPEAAAMYHLIGNVCGMTTDQMNHAHMTLAAKLGGQTASIEQKNLGNTLQVIIDMVAGKASPIKLDYVPISSSLAATLDAVYLTRSRSNGFDYRAATNALVFINVKYKKGSEVIASYKRWKRQRSDPL